MMDGFNAYNVSKTTLSKKKQRFFEIAKQISLMSSFSIKNVKIGCIIVSKKKHIISSGYNKEKSHTRQYVLNTRNQLNHKKSNSFIHAEIDAITSISESYFYAKHYLLYAEVYLYREDANGNLACSRPCPSCMAELKKLGIKKIHYTDTNGFFSERI